MAWLSITIKRPDISLIVISRSRRIDSSALETARMTSAKTEQKVLVIGGGTIYMTPHIHWHTDQEPRRHCRIADRPRSQEGKVCCCSNIHL